MRSITLFSVALLCLAAAAVAQPPPSGLTASLNEVTGQVTLDWNAPVAAAATEPEPQPTQDIRAEKNPRLAKLLSLNADWSMLVDVRELDEFIEYRIYRDGIEVGTADVETYTDALPSYGGYEYTVTAYYDEGESTPTNAVNVVWLDPADLALNEDFDSGLPDTWTIEASGPTLTWIHSFDDSAGRNLFPTPYMLVDSDIVGSGPHLVSRLISPEAVVENAEYVLLEYEYFFQEYLDEILQVAWSNTNGGPWNTLVTYESTTGGALFESMDITDEVGIESTILMSWLYDDQDNWGWYAAVDNILLFAEGAGGPVSFQIIPENTDIPAGGGTLVYDAHLEGQLPFTVPNMRYWTSIELPNGQVFEPVVWYQINLPQVFDITVTGLTQDVPDLAPPGEYRFTAYVGSYTNPDMRRRSSFLFHKAGDAVAGDGEFVFNPEEWQPGGVWTAGEAGSVANALPLEYEMSAAYPNPFNPQTTVHIALPEAADVNVTVYNIAGQQVAILANERMQAGTHPLLFDARGLSSGVYFVRANVPGELNAVQKVMLVR